MIISRTPFRVSFAGGGSDLPEFYREHGGAVLSTSIDKYMYLSMHPYFFENKFFLKYSKSELVDCLSDIKHPIIKEIFNEFNIKGVDFNSSADIPSGTGLASSSAFTAGLINLCAAYNNIYLSKQEIANLACKVEILKLNEPIGKQDQYACAIGGLNYLEFHEDDSVLVEKISLSPDRYNELNDSLLMFFLGESRSAGNILLEQKINTSKDKNNIVMLKKMVSLAQTLKRELKNNKIDDFGKILDEGWSYKKELASKISNSYIDEIYNTAMKNGAEGGKLLGAGGTGFLLFFVKPDKQSQIRKSLNGLFELNFRFENSGTTIIY